MCSRNEHLTSEFHTGAMKLRFAQILTPPYNLDIIKRLTGCLSGCDNNATTKEDESECFDSLLGLLYNRI
jgi:hypothetical protein